MHKENAVARLLIENGANTHPVHGNALQIAATSGLDATVLLLLEKGLDIDSMLTGSITGTAPQAAAYIGHESTVRILVENGANINMAGEKMRHRRTPLLLRGIINIPKVYKGLTPTTLCVA